MKIKIDGCDVVGTPDEIAALIRKLKKTRNQESGCSQSHSVGAVEARLNTLTPARICPRGNPECIDHDFTPLNKCWTKQDGERFWAKG